MAFKRLIMAGFGLVLLLAVSCSRNVFYFSSSIPEETTRYWIGPEYWANRLQDWRIHEGRIECLAADMPLRAVHLLTRSLGETTGDLRMSVRTGPIAKEGIARSAWHGFLVGAGSLDLEYRARALIHHGSGQGGGLVAGIDGAGQIVFLDNENGLLPLPSITRSGAPVPVDENKGIELQLFLRPQRDAFALTVAALEPETGEILQEATVFGIQGSRLTGSLALASHGKADDSGPAVWFDDWQVSGSKVEIHDERKFGPILCAL
ncbi:MAG: hypothetical protein ACWGQW_24280, partial [bacterium]